MHVPIYRADANEKLGEINPKQLIYDSGEGARPVEDGTAPAGVSWMEHCRDALGNRYRAVYQFSKRETEAAGENPERLPWDDKHLNRVELNED